MELPQHKHKPTNIVPDTFLDCRNAGKQSSFNEKFEGIVDKLNGVAGVPYYAKDGFILYNQSCVDFMKLFDSQFPAFDLIITSPPYNIGKEYESIMDVQEYVNWCSEWMNLLYLTTKRNSAFWLNVGYLEVPGQGLCVPIPYIIWDKSDYFLIQELVWQYGAGVQTKKRLSPRNEKWLFYVKNIDQYVFNLDEIRDPNVKYPNQRKNGKLRNNPLGKNPGDVWYVPKVTTGSNRSSKERVNHPAQFPLAVIERLVKVSSQQGNIIYDPFSGSGTVGIASHAFNRIFIGTEINREYCKISVDRFEQYKEYRSEQLSKLKLL